MWSVCDSCQYLIWAFQSLYILHLLSGTSTHWYICRTMKKLANMSTYPTSVKFYALTRSVKSDLGQGCGSYIGGWGANSRAPIKLSCTPFLAVRQYQCLQRHHDNRAGTCQIRTVLRIQSNVSTDTSGNDERWHGACNCFQIQPGYIEKPLLASGHPNGKATQWNSRDRSKIPKMSIM